MGGGVSAVILDLDGTLVDSAPDIRAAANAALAGEGAAPLTPDETRRFIGDGTEVFVARMIAARDLPGRAHGRLHAAFLAGYEGAVAGTRPMPGAAAALEALRAAGQSLALCTNKPEAPARGLLAHFGWADLFGAVIGGDSLPACKPDAAPLIAAWRALGGGPAIFVGDSETDAATARAAALPFALYTQGYRNEPVAGIGHDAAFDDFAALPGLIAAWPEAA